MRISSWALYAAVLLPSASVTGFVTTPRRTARIGGISESITSSASPSSSSWALCMTWGDRDYDDRGYSTSRRSSPYASPNGHDYERDTSGDASNVDDGAVNSLLGERLRARKSGDFDTADQIRDQLFAEHKVTVFDKDKIWVTGYNAEERGNRGGRFSDRPMRGRGDFGGRGGRGRGRGGRGRGQGRGGRGGNRDFRSDFGPTGHDYDPCAEAGPISSRLSESEIHEKVAERLMAKMNRDFQTADMVQLQLAEEGVYVNDRTKEWRADGVRFIDPSEGRRTPSDRNRPYVQSRHSQSLTDDQHMKIDQLVAERSKQKQLKNFMKADFIRDKLLDTLNVAIDDRIREWSIGGSFGEEADLKRAHDQALKNRDYVKSSASRNLPNGVTDEDVQARVDERMRAKYSGKYQEADMMRDDILEEFGVVIHDKIKMWSVGGNFGMDDPVKATARALSTYTRRGGGDLSEEDVTHIQAMLTKRFKAKKVRNFVVSDEIRANLYDTYNVNVDDKKREWRVLCDDYVQTKAERGAQELTGEDLSIVESIITRRAVLKKDQNYEEADDMRDMLQSRYSVLVDDKAKEWKVTTLVPGSSPSGGRSSPYNEKQRGHEEVLEGESIFLPTDGVRDELSVDPPSNAAATDAQEEESASPPSTLVLSRDDLTSLTVVLLKEKLREAGKPVSGKKAELIDRLLED